MKRVPKGTDARISLGLIHFYKKRTKNETSFFFQGKGTTISVPFEV